MVELNDQQQTWLRFAQNGDLLAAFNIGKFYADKGENEDAKKWLKVAAEKGHLGGLFKLGELFANLKEIDEAKVWLQKAADKGHAKAKELLLSL